MITAAWLETVADMDMCGTRRLDVLLELPLLGDRLARAQSMSLD